MEQQNEPKPTGSSNNTMIIIIIIIVIFLLLIVGIAGGGYYLWKKIQESKTIIPLVQPTPAQQITPVTVSSPTPTIAATTPVSFESPSTVIDNYLKSTLGTIPGSSIDDNKAKSYVSYELALQMDDASFVPMSYCIQDGPEDVKIDSELISADNIEADVIVSAKYGGIFDPMWQFSLINGEDGWKIKSITCMQTGQVTQ